MKRILTFLAFVAIIQCAMAVPAKRVFRTVTQPDGTTLQVTLCGDETFHFYATLEGVPVRQDVNGRWVADTRDVNAIWADRAGRRAASRRAHADRMKRILARNRSGRRNAPDATDEVMHKKGLLILVNFQDKKLVTPETSIHAIYDQILNSEGNPYGRNHGSVHEYFLDQSYGELSVFFDIKGPITLPNPMKYYGQDVDNSGNPSSREVDEGNDAHPGQMVYEALTAIKDEVRFADYDWDGDGEVENVYIIYAGYAQSSGAPSTTIWPHQWQLSEAFNKKFTYQGITIDTYACGSELNGVSGSTLDGIGTMCHEYSHCLGLPDFYDTGDSRNFGMDAWSIMDYGCYIGDGYCPAGYTAYERMYSGWLTPTELNSKCRVANLKPIEDEPQAYIVYNDNNHDEYYLLANHQKKGWDSSAYGHGMLVIHVDYDRNSWEDNTVNNTASRQRMTIIPADGKASSTAYDTLERELGGDPYPGTKKNTELTDTSSPKATLYRPNTDGQKLMHKDITGITESNGLISFNFMKNGPDLAPPAVNDTPSSTSTSFTASWQPVDGAVSYNIQFRTVSDFIGGGDTPTDIEDALVMYDECLGFYVPEGSTSDGSVDISGQLDNYTDLPGWTGEKVYQGQYGAKLGTSNAGGRLTSPSFRCTTGEVTLYLWCYDWLSASYVPDGSRPTVALIKPDGTQLTQQITPDDDNGILVRFSGVPNTCQLSVYTTSGKQRFYIDYFLAFDGVFTVDEIEDVFVESGDDDDDWDWWYSPRKRVKALAPSSADPVYGEWTTISGLATTSHTVESLTPGVTYQFRVQAVDADGDVSSWSEMHTVTLQQETPVDGVEDVAHKPHVSNEIYGLDGRRIASTKLRRGIYISSGRKIFKL